MKGGASPAAVGAEEDGFGYFIRKAMGPTQRSLEQGGGQPGFGRGIYEV